jgi:hypothetical protein
VVGVNLETNIKHLVEDFPQKPAMTVLDHNQLPHIQLHPLIINQPIKLKGRIKLAHLFIKEPNARIERHPFHDLKDIINERLVVVNVVLELGVDAFLLFVLAEAIEVEEEDGLGEGGGGEFLEGGFVVEGLLGGGFFVFVAAEFVAPDSEQPAVRGFLKFGMGLLFLFDPPHHFKYLPDHKVLHLLLVNSLNLLVHNFQLIMLQNVHNHQL